MLCTSITCTILYQSLPRQDLIIIVSYAISPHESAKLLHVVIVVSTILDFFQNHIQFVGRTVNQDNQENFV